MIRKRWQLHRKLLVSLAIVCIHFASHVLKSQAQSVIGARDMGLGQATTALQGSSWQVFSNPAMLVEDERSVSFYGVRYYGLSETSDIAAVVNYSTNYGVLAGGIHRYGFDLFNKTRLRIGYKNSYRGFHFGAILNYSHVYQGGGYGSAGALGIDLGLAASIMPNLWIGAKATNINQPEYGSKNDEKLYRDLSIGLSYRLSDVALFTTDVVKDVQFPISYRGGVEVKVIGGLLGRVGVSTKPQTFSAGFGYEGLSWSANIAVQQHENRFLGYSPAIDFKIIW